MARNFDDLFNDLFNEAFHGRRRRRRLENRVIDNWIEECLFSDSEDEEDSDSEEEEEDIEENYSPSPPRRRISRDRESPSFASDNHCSSESTVPHSLSLPSPFHHTSAVSFSNLTMSSTPVNINAQEPFRNESGTQDILIRRAEMYQKYMKQVPIPSHRGSVIPFNSWMGLGKSMKQLYGQPLHYLTNVLLKQWDQLRIGSNDEYKPLDNLIHPSKAEATIWLVEEVHRQTSHFHIAQLWKVDPMYNSFV